MLVFGDDALGVDDDVETVLHGHAPLFGGA
jgi:hypothetical protein